MTTHHETPMTTPPSTTDALGPEGHLARRPHPGWLIGLLVLALFARVYRNSEYSPWIDEQCSILVASGYQIDQGVWSLMGGARHVSNPRAPGHRLDAPLSAFRADFTGPEGLTTARFRAYNTLPCVVRATVSDGGNALLYYSVLHFWANAFGTSDAALRCLSAVFGVAVVGLTYRLGQVLSGHRVGLVAGTFCAIHPLLVRYGQEIRSYSMATMACLAATILFVRIVEGRTRSLGLPIGIAYGTMAGVAVLSHYLSAPVFLGHVLFAAAFVRDRRAWPRLSTGGILAVAMVGAWFALGGREGYLVIADVSEMYARQTRSNGVVRVVPYVVGHLKAAWISNLLILSGNWYGRPGVRLKWVALLPAALIGLTYFASRSRQGVFRFAHGFALLLVLSLIGLAAATALALRAGHFKPFQPLYETFYVPYFMILLASGVAGLATRGWASVAARLLITAQVLAMAVLLREVYQDLPFHRFPNPYVAFARKLALAAEAEDRIVYASWIDAAMVNVYLPPKFPNNQSVDDRLPAHEVRLVQGGTVRGTLTVGKVRRSD